MYPSQVLPTHPTKVPIQVPTVLPTKEPIQVPTVLPSDHSSIHPPSNKVFETRGFLFVIPSDRDTKEEVGFGTTFQQFSPRPDPLAKMLHQQSNKHQLKREKAGRRERRVKLPPTFLLVSSLSGWFLCLGSSLEVVGLQSGTCLKNSNLSIRLETL